MFTGIIEDIGYVLNIEKQKDNLNFCIKSKITDELKVDQSVSHNGVCLTVVKIDKDKYYVTAIKETLKKTNLSYIKENDLVNLERCLKLGDRLDGHLVQGHVDQTATCTNIIDDNGSKVYTFQYDDKGNLTVEKGSICVNGVSLTVIDSMKNSFSVAIIPYTMENTNFHKISLGTIVNLEFDILGKYIVKMNNNEAY
ncbi:MAG: riboflavin synthase [Flavobacteriales bacterium]|nr:riboflavin synthase [Flavobacteriales bacterium]